jgi:acyl-CoA thioester hydrolase
MAVRLFVKGMAQSVSTSITMRVPYHDVDLMRIVWHGNYLKYFEVARQALFREHGVDLQRYMEDTGYVFPIVRSTIKHVWPLRYDDEFSCTAVLKEAHVRIVLDFEIKLTSNGRLCAKGWTEQVAVLLPEMEMVLQIPEEIQKAFYGNERLK